MIATMMDGGQPHAMPVNFVLDGDKITFIIGRNSVKGQNLLRDPRIAVVIQDDTLPCAFVHIRGTAEISENHAAMVQAGIGIGRHYFGPDGGEPYAERWAVPGELLVSVSLETERVITMTEIFVG
jgi:PPOX class probable F420-dependent enzyme